MPQPPILIVEDDDDLRALLGAHLRKEGFETVEVATGRDALEQVSVVRPALVLLDLKLSDMRGTEICRRIRATPAITDVPVVILSAHGDEIDRVVAFELGVDDYVVKSELSLRELALRIRAVLRRTRRPIEAPRAPTSSSLSLDREGHRVWADGREVTLTPTEFRLLALLVERDGHVLTRHALVTRLRSGGENVVDARSIDTYVKRLRQKLGPSADAIVTVRGVGYRFEPKPPTELPPP